MGDNFFPNIMFVRAHMLAEKGPQPSRGSNLGSSVPKMVPGVENTKLAYRKTMQNPVVGIPNGAICCKLRPHTILGPPRHMVPVMAYFRRPEFRDLAESRPRRFCVGRASPPPSQNLLDPRPQAWDSTQAKMPGSNPRSGAWDRGVFSHVQGLLDPGKNT